MQEILKYLKETDMQMVKEVKGMLICSAIGHGREELKAFIKGWIKQHYIYREIHSDGLYAITRSYGNIQANVLRDLKKMHCLVITLKEDIMPIKSMLNDIILQRLANKKLTFIFSTMQKDALLVKNQKWVNACIELTYNEVENTLVKRKEEALRKLQM